MGRNRGAGTTKTPEDAICPCRFPLLGTDGNEAKSDIASGKINSDGVNLSWRQQNKPCVICVSAHVKFVSGWESQWSLKEALQDEFCVFSHVELKSRQILFSLTKHSLSYSALCGCSFFLRDKHCKAFQKNSPARQCVRLTPHLISLQQQRQLIAVNGTFHHMDVIVFNTEI